MKKLEKSNKILGRNTGIKCKLSLTRAIASTHLFQVRLAYQNHSNCQIGYTFVKEFTLMKTRITLTYLRNILVDSKQLIHRKDRKVLYDTLLSCIRA